MDKRLRKLMDEYGDFRDQRDLEEQYRLEALQKKNSVEALAVWERKFKGLDKKEENLKAALTEYLKDVAVAYRLPTKIGDRHEIKVGAFKGETVPFAPQVILDDIFIETKKDPRDRRKTITYARDYRGDPAAASTISNGSVVFRASGFEWKGRAKAGIVASYLYHESVHFRHLTSRSTAYTREWSEAAAYTAVTELADSVFMLEEEFKNSMANKAAENLNKISADKAAKRAWREQGGLMRGKKIPTPEPNLLTGVIQDDDDWRILADRAVQLGKVPDGIKKQRDALARRLRVEREERGNFDWRVEAERNERFGLPPPPPPGGVPPSGGSGSSCPGAGSAALPMPCLPSVTPSRPPSIYRPPPPPVIANPARPAVPAQAWSAKSALNAMAAKGCADPWSISQPDIDRDWQRILKDGGDLTIPAGLQGCQKKLYESLSAMAAQGTPSRLTQEVFARTAEAARNPSPVSTVDEFPDIPGQQWPEIPTCRHHDWCKEHPLNRGR